MRNMLDSVTGCAIAGAFGAIALGLLTAAAVVLLVPHLGTAAALAILGGVHLLVALIALLWMRRRRSRYVPSPAARNAQLGVIAGGFLTGVVEALIRRNRR